MKICMAGACGRMGRRILEMAAREDDITIGGAFDLPANDGAVVVAGTESGKPVDVTVSSDAAAEIAKADVLIDFTLPEGVVANVRAAAEAGKAAVIARPDSPMRRSRSFAPSPRACPSSTPPT